MFNIPSRVPTKGDDRAIDRGRSLTVLAQHFSATCDLVRAIDCSRLDCHGEGFGTVESLLEDLRDELHACASILLKRIEAVAPELDVAQPARKPIRPTATITPGCERDLCPQLASLLDEYASYEHECECSIAILEILGDLDSLRLVNRSAAIAAKGKWYLSSYLKALTAPEKAEFVPEWPHLTI